jgi:ribosomal protein S1
MEKKQKLASKKSKTLKKVNKATKNSKSKTTAKVKNPGTGTKKAKKTVAKTLVTPSLQLKPISHKAGPEPHTMEELLQLTGYQMSGLRKGQRVKGIVTEIDKKHMLIDIGAKTEGIVTNKEYEAIKDYIEGLKVGDEIEAIVGMPENDKGQILLSLRQKAMDYQWDMFTRFMADNQPIEVRGLEINKGGVIVRYRGMRGFVPASQFGREWLGKLSQLQNRSFTVKVIEIDREKNRLIFSEKLVSEAAALKSQEEALKLVKIGDTYQGTVSGIMPFGVFVRVDIEEPAKNKKKKTKETDDEEFVNDSLFLEGLVHISEVSWQKVNDLNKIYRVGQKLQIKILSINEKTSKLNLSIKQLQVDPWKDLVKKYQKDTKVAGRVSKLAAFGAFVSLEEGVEGLLHISKIPADFDIKVGQEIDVYVESVDPDKKKISLGLVLKTKPVGYK